MKIILRVFRYTNRYPGYAIGTLACAVVATLMVAVFPNVTQRIIDDVINGGRHELLVPLTLTALAAFFIRDGLNAFRIILNNTFEQKVIFDLRSDLYGHVQHLPLTWFDDRSTGDLMTRVVEDVNAVERVLIDGIEQGVVAVLQIVVVSALLFSYNAKLALLALAPIPFLIAGALAYTLTAHIRYRAQRKAASAMNSLLHDNLAGIRQIKTFVQEENQHARFNETSGTVMKTTLRVMLAWAIYNPSMSFFTNCGLVLIIGFGGAAVLDGTIDVGVFVGFLTAARFLYEPIERLHGLNQLFQAGRAAGERVFEIMDTPVEASGKSSLSNGFTTSIKGEVEYRDVSFSYESNIPVLKHITLHARPGETVALVGPTGAGKSSLAALLSRFYEYDDGEITIDGVSIHDIPRPQLREAIGVVTQESFLFNGTVRDNLLLAAPDANEASMWKSLAAARADDFVRAMSSGLDTVVGERGVKLSVGEKQRISIARVLLKNPPILILDEATASVDNQTERLIQAALDELLRNRTAFVIAHRLSTVRAAHQILVMRAGRIVERGRHEDLLAADGLYAKLVQHAEEVGATPLA